MIKILQEITEGGDYPNHTYFVDTDKDKCYAYIIAGTDKKITFEKPLTFSRSKRKFKTLKET